MGIYRDRRGEFRAAPHRRRNGGAQRVAPKPDLAWVARATATIPIEPPMTEGHLNRVREAWAARERGEDI
jgi:hypothetical protein